jgi:hypothetical protein
MEFIEFLENKISIWLDDERDPNDHGIQEDFHSFPGMTWAKTATEAIELLKTGKVEYISFDHDLGSMQAGTGMDVAKWIEEQAFHGNIPKLSWTVHSYNPIGSKNIIRAMKKAEEFWGK